MPFGLSAGAIAAIGAGVSAAGAVGGSLIQANAAKSAASKANATQQAGLEQARADIGPWSATGGQANTASADLLGLNGPDAATAAMGNFQTSPGYQFSLDQGLRAVDAGAAAKGMLRSGAALKAEQTFGSGLADQDFTNYYNRLFDLSKLGENAAGGTAQASTNAATGQAQTDLSLGSAQTSIYGNVAQGIGNAANSYANNSLYQNRLMGGYTGPGTTYASLDPSGTSIAPTRPYQPDSYYLPGGAGY
jgi:hypothetical protein